MNLSYPLYTDYIDTVLPILPVPVLTLKGYIP